MGGRVYKSTVFINTFWFYGFSSINYGGSIGVIIIVKISDSVFYIAPKLPMTFM